MRQDLLLLWMFYSEGGATFQKVSRTGTCLWSVRDLTKQYEVSLSRMLHDILDDDHIQWHPPLIRHYINFWPLLIWTLLPNLTFSLIVRGFHRIYATGAACKLRTLTPPDTWSCPTLGLACVLMSRPISPELVLFPDFWISNIPRYFSFAYLSLCPSSVRATVCQFRPSVMFCFKLRSRCNTVGYNIDVIVY